MKTLRISTALLLCCLAAFAAGLTITSTTPLVPGVRGQAYTKTLAASGGTAPYTWSVVDGALCDGLALSADGVVSGTPATFQTCSFTVQVQDSESATATKPLTIAIRGGGVRISGGTRISGATIK